MRRPSATEAFAAGPRSLGEPGRVALADALWQTNIHEARVAAAEAARAQAATALADTELLAPSSGTVIARVREPGSMVANQSTVYSLSLDKPVYVRAYVGERDLGRIAPGTHRLDTPVGVIGAELHEDGSVSIANVPSWRHASDVPLDVEGLGRVHGDIAWGGNWFFLVTEHQQRVESSNIEALTEFAWAIRQALEAQGVRSDDGGIIDHVELFADDARFDSRNFVLCPGRAYDRSPCGTGTSAKLACLAADGKLQPGQVWRQASIIGSHFDASYQLVDGKVIPTLRGRAHMSAEATLLIEADDPFGWGIRL